MLAQPLEDWSDDDEILRTGIALCSVLLETLDEELQLVLARDADRLDALFSRKQQILDDIAAIEQDLLLRLADLDRQPVDSELHRLRELMIQCRDNNKRNQAAAVTGMRVSRQSLQLLRGMLHLDDLALYDAGGELKTMREKRKLGRL